jgi:hypothetical protein
MFKRSTTTKSRTYFLEIIAKEEEIGYSVSEQCDLLPQIPGNAFCRIEGKNT